MHRLRAVRCLTVTLVLAGVVYTVLFVGMDSITAGATTGAAPYVSASAEPTNQVAVANASGVQWRATTEAPAGAPRAQGPAAPSVAFLILGYEESGRPVWASDHDDVLIFAPPAKCPTCPEHAQQSAASGPYRKAPEAWWCAQRSFLDGLSLLLLLYPDKDYYFFADANTAVFPTALQAMMRILDTEVLLPTDDLYIGHGFDIGDRDAELGVNRFIQSGGGVLIRGLTLRRLAATDVLNECVEHVYNGTWCWHHLDWIMGECLKEINVWPQGHPGFQQHVNFCGDYAKPWGCCHEVAVACHPVDEQDHAQLVGEHERYLQANKAWQKPDWARPCDDESFEWRNRGWGVVSICNSWDYAAFAPDPRRRTSSDNAARGFR